MAAIRPRAILLTGPTASGKTDLAVALARRLPVELISVDSAQVYRGMDIGTAKPSLELRAEVPHHLVDILDPVESYSAARFRTDALARMEAIRRRGRVPLLVGGTMLYFHALRHGLSELPPADPELRRRLEAEYRALGGAALHARLAGLDPAAARRIHPNDPQRLLRALEVIRLTGRPLSELQRGGEPLDWELLVLVLAPSERSALHRRIESRFHRMLEEGFEAEVAALLERPGVHAGLPSMRAVGYRQMVDYLEGRCTRQEMIERGIVATRQLARRQLTWLRRETAAHRLEESRATEQALALAEPFVRCARPTAG